MMTPSRHADARQDYPNDLENVFQDATPEWNGMILPEEIKISSASKWQPSGLILLIILLFF